MPPMTLQLEQLARDAKDRLYTAWHTAFCCSAAALDVRTKANKVELQFDGSDHMALVEMANESGTAIELCRLLRGDRNRVQIVESNGNVWHYSVPQFTGPPHFGAMEDVTFIVPDAWIAYDRPKYIRAHVPDSILHLEKLWSVGRDCAANASMGHALSVSPCMLCRGIHPNEGREQVYTCIYCLLSWHRACSKATKQICAADVAAVSRAIPSYPTQLAADLLSFEGAVCDMCLAAPVMIAFY